MFESIFKGFGNIARIPELRNKILFTLGMLAVFRIGHWIPLPGVNQEALSASLNQQDGSTFDQLATMISMFSGAAFSHSTIFGLGVLPYISASIIFQLLTTVSPRLKKLQEEGPTGRQKIMEWTRYATIGLCLIQGYGWLQYINVRGLVYAEWSVTPLWWVVSIAALTAGTVFLMWLGEQIDKYGIGNGVSMIIMAGILTQMPTAITWIVNNFDPANPAEKMGYLGLLSLILGFVVVTAGAVLMTVAQRRIPVQQAKHTRGRKVFGGQRSYLPLRVNHSGVMPVVFASSLMIFPSVVFNLLFNTATGGSAEVTGFWARTFSWLNDQFAYGEYVYVLGEVLLIYFFSYFWITVQFNPEEMAKQLKEHGSFIPGLRPGPRTAEYLEAVMERITYVGAAFLSAIAILPMVISRQLGVDMMVTQFLGGTGLLIVVSVVLDFIQRVEANLLMRNYAGFLTGEDGKGPRIQSSRGGAM
ncbi:MAG: preprotein translocase subunit SecY [Planctomycetaceae bacterium]|jgi:preprotein translocase subunit SecY|nr:preprotein translocase subunit SecY [Phycisphaerales bacterium]MCE2652306.1 preprotein translocase subunit SecY [Planctomycetaceae bacterium]